MTDIQELEQFVLDCHEALLKHDNEETNKAWEYLLGQRHWSLRTLKAHKIGYCKSSVRLPDGVRFYGRDPDKRSGDGYFKYLLGRITVPVYAEFGNIVGMATRGPVPGKSAHWWNLPRPFYKGNHLFLLDKARQNMFDSDKAYVVEGYADALMLYQTGLKNVCALMGTKLTLRKLALLSRYCGKICLCLDVDENKAGQKATDDIVATLYRFNMCDGLSIIDGLPLGADPDEFVMRNGIEKFLELERPLAEEEIEEMCRRSHAA